MKKLTVSIVTLFFVLFGSVFIASAEETTNISFGQVTAKKDLYYPKSGSEEVVEVKLPAGDYNVLYVYNEAEEKVELSGMYKIATKDSNIAWVSKKDGNYTSVSGKVYPGVFTTDKEVTAYRNYSDKVGKISKGSKLDTYEYKNGKYLVKIENSVEQTWLSEDDVDFDLTTKDKETSVTTTSIGTIVAVEKDASIHSNFDANSSVVGNLKLDDLKTKLDVKGKTNGFYNVGLNQWVNGNPDEVRFFPAGTKTNLYKLIYDVRDLEDSPYVKGGITEAGFDNTGFIYRVFKDQGYRVGKFTSQTFEKIVAKTTKPQIGDLIFLEADKDGNRDIGIIVDANKYVASKTATAVQTYTFDVNDTTLSFGRLR